MKINLYEYCNTTEWYQLDINDEYLARLESDIKAHAVDPTVIPHITEDMVKMVINNDYNTDDDVTYESYNYDKTQTYKNSLYDTLNDWIRDDIWDNFVETVDCDGNGYEIELED